MANERRWGDLEVRKRVVVDFKEKTTTKNNGIRTGAFIPHHHEGIVTPEVAKAAHMMRASRFQFNSVPDVSVIDGGALKGFVSISPKWRGIDNQSFQTISKQVYLDEEFEELRREARIFKGEEKSNIVSLTLNDYRVAPGVIFMSRSDPQLTLSLKSLMLNRVCHNRLDSNEYIEVLYHPVLEVIAIRNCDADNPNAILWDKADKPLKIATSAFSGAIYDKQEWMRKYNFRFRGVTRERDGEKIVFFFLDEPQILVGKDKARLDAENTDNAPAIYIPYKESTVDVKTNVASVAYPENWQDSFGVSYEIKKRRSRILGAVSSKDITNRGIKVVNPFIGSIPSQEELENEVEQLYMSM